MSESLLSMESITFQTPANESERATPVTVGKQFMLEGVAAKPAMPRSDYLSFTTVLWSYVLYTL